MNFIKDFLELFHTTPFGEVPKPLINHTIDDSFIKNSRHLLNNFHLEIDIEKQTCNLPIQIIENNYLNIANYLDCKKLIEVLCCFISSRDYLYGPEFRIWFNINNFTKKMKTLFQRSIKIKNLIFLNLKWKKRKFDTI